MSKGLGQKIAIKFTQDLIGDIQSQPQAEKLPIVNAIASSQFDTGYLPEFAIDGDPNTRWASLNKSGTQYIQFDLGEIRRIESVKAMCGAGYVTEAFDLLVSDDGENFTTASADNKISVANTLMEFTFSPVTCRYVRVVMVSTSNANFFELREFEVYGFSGREVAFSVTGQRERYINSGIYDNEDYIIESVERHVNDNRTLLLTTNKLSRFNNSVGEITVKYDKSRGSLQGEGGAVESFEMSFLPTDLIPLPNPHEAERFNITATCSLDFIKVAYNNRYATEKFAVTPICNVILTPVGEINP